MNLVLEKESEDESGTEDKKGKNSRDGKGSCRRKNKFWTSDQIQAFTWTDYFGAWGGGG